MDNPLWISALVSIILGLARSEHSSYAFDDSILYNINWPGKNGFQLVEEPEGAKSMVVTTHEQETYKCILPVIKESKKDSDEDFNWPNPVELLHALFTFSPCTTLLESYWTYELCHGKHIRQYHEDREGKKVKIQEYILGKWDKKLFAKMSAEFGKKSEGRKFNPPMKKLDSVTLPYLQFNFTDGTLCDLNDKPRKTNVLYVCYPSGKNDIFSIKETSTCEYEVIVISPELCKHPKYKPQVNVEHDINCVPVGDSPTKPRSLLEMEEDILRQTLSPSFDDSKNGHTFAVYSIDEFKDKDGKTQVMVEIRPVNPDPSSELPSGLDALDQILSPTDQGNRVNNAEEEEFQGASVVVDGDDSRETDLTKFLTGKLCINGGYGWWKYHFCYGAPIEQYHTTAKEGGGRGSKAMIILGVWDEEAHKKWLKSKPSKRPKPLAQRTYISHYYGNGDICGETGKPRETEVRLQCNDKSGPQTAMIYHLEPHVCQYILVFESPLVCQLLPKVDEDGLVDVNTLFK